MCQGCAADRAQSYLQGSLANLSGDIGQMQQVAMNQAQANASQQGMARNAYGSPTTLDADEMEIIARYRLAKAGQG